MEVETGVYAAEVHEILAKHFGKDCIFVVLVHPGGQEARAFGNIGLEGRVRLITDYAEYLAKRMGAN